MIVNPLKRKLLPTEVLIVREQRLLEQIKMQMADSSASDVPFGYLRGFDQLEELVGEMVRGGKAAVHEVFFASLEAVGKAIPSGTVDLHKRCERMNLNIIARPRVVYPISTGEEVLLPLDEE